MNLKAAQEIFWERWASLRHLISTVLASHRFAHWGARSRIERSSKLMSPHLVVVGNQVHICEQAWLNAKDTRGDGQPTLRIADRTYIGRFVQINAWQSVTIEEDVLISDRVFISDADHNFRRADIPIGMQGDAYIGPVTLCDGCWIGIGAVILPGVRIGRNAVVAANAVVTRDVPDRTVVGGIPAKIIRHMDAKG